VKRLAIAALLVCAAAPARAETPEATRYAVVELAADDEVRDPLQDGLAAGVANAGADLIRADDVGQTPCEPPGCLPLRVTATADGANFAITIELLDETGSAIRKRTASCVVCTVEDLARLAEARVYELLTAEPGAPVEVAITSRPDGATLEIPEHGSQTAPWSGRLAPGVHQIAASLPGYQPARREVTVLDDGSEQRFEIALAPLPERFRRIKWATAGGAAALLLTGIVLIALDGNPTCDVPDATCPREYATAAPGVVLGVLGLAGGGAAGWMFWQEDF
jgi:hypothetical protein